MIDAETLARIRAALTSAVAMRKAIEVVERNEEWNGGQPTYGTPQKFAEVKRSSDDCAEVLRLLNYHLSKTGA